MSVTRWGAASSVGEETRVASRLPQVGCGVSSLCASHAGPVMNFQHRDDDDDDDDHCTADPGLSCLAVIDFSRWDDDACVSGWDKMSTHTLALRTQSVNTII